MKPFRQTYQIDPEALATALAKLEALDGDTDDDIDDLPESVPLDRTTVTFFGNAMGGAGTAEKGRR